MSTAVTSTRGPAAIVLVGILVLVVWYALVFAPQREALAGVLESTAADAQKVDQIGATLGRATAIRHARADVLARLSDERRSQRRAIEQTLLLLDDNARSQRIAIVAISPIGGTAASPTKSSATAAGTELTVSVEGSFVQIMRFLEAASASIAPLEIGDVRLHAERRDGNAELLLAQINARAYQFSMPR